MQTAFKFFLILLIVPILCQDRRVEKAFVKGSTFQGEVTLSGNILRIEIVEFTRGRIYLEEITNELIEKESVRFMVFKNTEELFEEIKDNEKMSIVDCKLRIPLEVTYKRRRAELNLEILLSQRRFESEEERFKTLLLIIEAINNEKARMQRELTPRRIDFKPDRTNKNINFFEVSEGGRRVKMLGDTHYVYNNAEVLPKRGIHFFQIKILQTKNRWIMVGICGKNIKQNIYEKAFYSPFFMGYHLLLGRIYGNGGDYVVTSPPNIIYGQTVIRMEIDMNKKWFTVYLDRNLLYATEIRKELTEIDIYPLVLPHQKDDLIEFVR